MTGLEVERGPDFQDIDVRWFEAMRIADPAKTKEARNYLEGVARRFMDLDDVHVGKIRVLISDDDDINAFVIKKEPDDAVIAVTRALLKFVETEDMLAGVVGHEEGHVEFVHRFGPGHNSRGEEIGGDVLSAQWMEQAGWNWRASQRFFRKLAAEEKGKRKGGVWDYIGNLFDVHSESLDRSQHIQTAMGAIALKQNRELKEPPETPLPPEIKVWAAERGHTSTTALLMERDSFAAMEPRRQLEWLADLDPAHYRQVYFPKEERYPRMTLEEYLESEAHHWRRRDVHQAVHAALDAWAEKRTKAGLTHWIPEDDALLDKIVDITGLYEDIQPLKGVPYHTIDHDVYNKINRLRHGETAPLQPLGTPLKELDKTLRAFVSADTPEEAVSAAQSMNACLKRHTILQVQLKHAGTDYLKLEDVFFYRRMAFSGFSLEQNWEKHKELAALDKAGVIAAMLWHAGLNLDKALWDALDPADIVTLAEKWNFTQGADNLAAQSFTHPALMDAIRQDQLAGYSKQMKEKRREYELDIRDRSKEFQMWWGIAPKDEVEAFAGFAEEAHRNWKDSLTVDMGVVETGGLRTAMTGFFDKHLPLMKLPFISREIWHSEAIRERDMAIHNKRVALFLSRASDCLAAGHPDDRAALRAFFLNLNRHSEDKDVNLGQVMNDYAGLYLWPNAFTDFVQAERSSLFSKLEKAEILFSLCKSAGQLPSKQKVELLFWRPLFDYAEPQNFSGVLAMTSKLDLYTDADLQLLADIGDDKWTAENRGYRHRRDLKAVLIDYELGSFIETKKPALFTFGFAAFAAAWLDRADYLIPREEWLRRNYFYAMREHAKQCADTLPDALDRAITELSTDQIIDIYHLFNRDSLFPNLAFKTTFGNKLLDCIKAAGDTSERARLLERLAFTGFRGQPVESREDDGSYSSFWLSDFAVSKEAIKIWAQDSAALIGKDDGGEAFADRIAPLLDRIDKGLTARDRFYAFRCLTDAITAQERVCTAVKNRLKINRETFTKADLPLRSMETILDYLRADRAHMRDNLDFFTKAENDSDTVALSNRIMNWLDTEKSGIVKMLLTMGLNLTKDRGPDMEKDPVFNARLEQYFQTLARQLHRFFWSRDLDMRALFMNSLLVSSKDLATDSEKAWRDALEVTLDRLFPVKASTYDVRNHWSREFLAAHVESMQESERSLALAGLLSAARVSEAENAEPNYAERLALILGMRGPAYKKGGQKAHSHPDLPEDIRPALANTKSMNVKATRWDYLDHIERAVPESVRAQIGWVGDIVGNASFFTTGPVRMKDGRDLMLGVLADDAAKAAEHEFTRLEETANILAAHNPEFAESADIILSMIRQARDLVKVETNMHLGAKQTKIMQEMYNGLEVAVRGESFEFGVMRWHMYGDKFKLMDIAPGVHFDELPEETPEQAAHKSRVATATSVPFFKSVLGLRRVNCDDHERQMHIDGDRIGIFDPGGMMLDLPTQEDKKHLKRALAAITPALIGANDLQPADAGRLLNDHLKTLERETGSYPDYLLSLHQALLMRNGFHRHMTRQDFSDILSTLMRGRHIDSGIRNTLAFNAAASGLNGASLKTLAAQFGGQGRAITIRQRKLPPPPEPVYVGDQSVKLPLTRSYGGECRGEGDAPGASSKHFRCG